MIFMEDQNKSNEEDYLNAITKDKKVAKDKKSDDVSKAELKKKEKEEKKKAKKEGKKHGNGLIVAVTILAVLFGISSLVAFFAIAGLISNEHRYNPAYSTTGFTECETGYGNGISWMGYQIQDGNGCVVINGVTIDKRDKIEMYEIEEELAAGVVRKVLSGTSELARQYGPYIRFQDNSVLYKLGEDGPLAPIKKTIGAQYDTRYNLNVDEVNNATANILTNLGYSKHTEDSLGNIYYKNDEAKSICGFGAHLYGVDEHYWSIACASESWIDDDFDDKNTIVEMAKTYEEKEGKAMGPIKSMKEERKDYRYEVATIYGLDGNTYVFYRRNSSDVYNKWIYAYSTYQSSYPKCEIFDNDDEMREAFSGSTQCVGSDGATSTVYYYNNNTEDRPYSYCDHNPCFYGDYDGSDDQDI